jgi:hypothetical protein
MTQKSSFQAVWSQLQSSRPINVGSNQPISWEMMPEAENMNIWKLLKLCRSMALR